MPKKQMAVFRPSGAMFSNLWGATCFLRWAETHSLTPVIDFGSSDPMNRKVLAPVSDGWLDYFEPVSSASAKQAVADPETVV